MICQKMDKQEIKEKLITYLERQNELLIRSRDQAKIARDSAPSAMESHSDTTRSEKEELVYALDRDIVAMHAYIKAALEMEPEYLVLTGENSTLKVLLVPAGIGGKMIDDIMLLGMNSPLGQAVAGVKSGDEFEFNGQKWKVN
jgi:hypothetical protein